MMYKAIVSFSGYELSMRAGEVRDISDASLASGLLKAKYIIPFEANVVAKEEPKKVEKKTSTKGKGKAK
jgi:hypothetical protein